jgi:hypothetical protein
LGNDCVVTTLQLYNLTMCPLNSCFSGEIINAVHVLKSRNRLQRLLGNSLQSNNGMAIMTYGGDVWGYLSPFTIQAAGGDFRTPWIGSLNHGLAILTYKMAVRIGSVLQFWLPGVGILTRVCQLWLLRWGIRTPVLQF